MVEMTTDIFVCEDLAIRQMVFPHEGSVVDGHEHNFPHMTYITHGDVLVEKLEPTDKELWDSRKPIPGTEFYIRQVVIELPGMKPIILDAGSTMRMFDCTIEEIENSLVMQIERVMKCKYEPYTGEFKVIKSVVKKASSGFNWVPIPAGVCHRLTCLSVGGALGHCTYPHRNHEGDIVQEYDGFEPGYE